MAKQSYGDVGRKLQALLEKQQEMENKAAANFTEIIMKSGAKEKLASLSKADVQAVARLVVGNMDRLIEKVQTDKTAKAEKNPQQPIQQAPTQPIQQVGMGQRSIQ